MIDHGEKEIKVNKAFKPLPKVFRNGIPTVHPPWTVSESRPIS